MALLPSSSSFPDPGVSIFTLEIVKKSIESHEDLKRSHPR
jgi:hypothetical protein